MITDEDLVPFEFSDFWEDTDADAVVADAAPSSRGIVPEYVDRQISRIPIYGDNSRWRLASHLDMFENLSADGSLTPEQREAVDNFAIGWAIERSESGEGSADV